MARKLPPLNALRAFESVGRLGSVVQAADELNVTPGAVSRQIKSLEAWCGVELFDRRYRQLLPTKLAQDYLQVLTQALDGIEAATLPITASQAKVVLRLCSYPTVVQRWLIPLWTRYYQSNPELEIQFVTSMDPGAELGAFDAVIMVDQDPVESSNYASLALFDIVIVPVCSPALIADDGLSHDQLSDLTLIHNAARPNDWLRWLTYAKVEGVDAARGPVFENFNLAIQAAMEGLGVLLVDQVLVARELQNGELVQPFGPARKTKNEFRLVYRKSHAKAKALARFARWIRLNADNMYGDFF